MRLCQVVRRAEPFGKAGVREGRVHGQAESSEDRFVAVSELAAAQTGAMYTHSIRATTVAELNAGGDAPGAKNGPRSRPPTVEGTRRTAGECERSDKRV